jgi:Ca2+-binding EF-hand superfamily protein
MKGLGRKDIAKYGVNTQFSSSNQPNNPGRKKNIIKQYIKDYDVSLDDIKAMITNLIFVYTPDEINNFLKEKDKDKKPSIGVIMILKALMVGMETGSLENWVILMYRAYGKASQKMDITSGSLPLTVMTQEERQKRLDELLKKAGKNVSKSKSVESE